MLSNISFGNDRVLAEKKSWLGKMYETQNTATVFSEGGIEISIFAAASTYRFYQYPCLNLFAVRHVSATFSHSPIEHW